MDISGLFADLQQMYVQDPTATIAIAACCVVILIAAIFVVVDTIIFLQTTATSETAKPRAPSMPDVPKRITW